MYKVKYAWVCYFTFFFVFLIFSCVDIGVLLFVIYLVRNMNFRYDDTKFVINGMCAKIVFYSLLKLTNIIYNIINDSLCNKLFWFLIFVCFIILLLLLLLLLWLLFCWVYIDTYMRFKVSKFPFTIHRAKSLFSIKQLIYRHYKLTENVGG